MVAWAAEEAFAPTPGLNFTSNSPSLYCRACPQQAAGGFRLSKRHTKQVQADRNTIFGQKFTFSKLFFPCVKCEIYISSPQNGSKVAWFWMIKLIRTVNTWFWFVINVRAARAQSVRVPVSCSKRPEGMPKKLQMLAPGNRLDGEHRWPGGLWKDRLTGNSQTKTREVPSKN